MARDTSRLLSADKKTYDDFAKVFGEAYADNWYDKNAKIPAAAPTAAPIAAPIAGEEVLGEMLRPSVGEMQARLRVGEFQVPPAMKDIFLEEQKALEAQKQRFVDLGEKTDAEVRTEIATGLSQQGLSPIGPTSDEFKRKFEEEYGAAQTAERRAAEVVAPAREARTPGFTPRPPIVGATTIAKDPTQVERMGGLEAIGSAFKPQVLETPDETFLRKERESRQKQLDDSANTLARETGISVAQAKSNILDQTKQQFRMDAVRELGAGFTNEEYDAQATEMYDKWLEENLPSEYSRGLRERTDTRAGAEAMVGDVRSRSLEFLLGAAASDKYDPQIYKEFKQKLGVTPQTESVVESLPMTIVRDLAGVSRFVFNPLLDLAFYDVEPGTDEKINPEEYGFLPRERTGAKEQGAWGKSYIAARTPGSIDDSLREMAVEIATARSLGDDLAAQSAVRPEDEDLFRGVGLLSEVALPLNIFSVPGKVAGTTARAGRAAAKSLKLADLVPGSVAEMFNDIAKVGELAEVLPGKAADAFTSIPSATYNALVRNRDLISPLVNAAKKFDVTLGDELVKSTKLLDKLIDSNKVSSVVAINTADQYNALRWIASGVKLDSPVASRIAKDAPQIWAAVTDPTAIASPQRMAQKILEDISKSKAAPSSNTAKSALVPVSETAIDSGEAYDLSRQVLRNSLVEDLSDTSLGGWTFITPNVVMSTTAAKKAMPRLVAEMKTAIDDYVYMNPITGKPNLKKSVNVPELLSKSVVQNSERRLSYYDELFWTSRPGSELSPQQYKALNDIVAENIVYRLSKGDALGGVEGEAFGAFAPSRAGRAIQSASEPIELRSDLIQFKKQATENVKLFAQNLLKKQFVNAPPAKYVDAVVNSYAGFLEGFPAQFSNTIRELSRAGRNEKEIYSALLARTYATDVSKAPELARAAIENDKLFAQYAKLESDLIPAQERLATYKTARQNAVRAGLDTTSIDKSIRSVNETIRDIVKQQKKLLDQSSKNYTEARAAAKGRPVSKTGAVVKPTEDVGYVVQIDADDSVRAVKDVMRVQFNLDYSTARGKGVEQIIEQNRSLFQGSDPLNGRQLYEHIELIRSKIVSQFPELLDQEVVSTFKRGARTRAKDSAIDKLSGGRLGVSSLPETVLAVTFENSKKAAFNEILNANRAKIYDDVAIEATERIAGGIVSDEVIIKALNDGLYARLDNPGAADVVGAIRQSLLDSGIEEKVINELFAKKGVVIVDTVNKYAIDAYRRSPGWMPVDGAQTLRRIDSAITKIGDEDYLGILPSKMQADIAFIQKNLADAKKSPIVGQQIAEVVTELERQSPGLMGRVVGDVSALFGMTYSSLVEGMLAGRVFPNVTYLSENVAGAPLIAAVTNPEYIDAVLKNVPGMASRSIFQALPGAPSRTPILLGGPLFDSYSGDFRNYGGYTQKYYDATAANPNARALVTPAGEEISNAQLWDLITEARLGRAQATVVSDPKVINQIRDLTEIIGEQTVPKQWLKETTKQLLDIAPSGRTSVPFTVATNADMAFRQELFVEALRRGKTPVEAAAIARDTLLDYNKLNEVLPGKLGALRKPFLFLSFSASMSLAILKGATRAEPVENMLRIARAHRGIAKNSGVFAPDGPMLESMYLDQQATIGDKPVTYLYARDPVMGQIFWMAGLVDNFKNVIVSDKPVEAGLELFDQVGYVPWFNFVKDILTAKKGTVNARQVSRWQDVGMWEYAQEKFDIEEVPIEKMRRGEPTFEGKQYRFKTAAGKQKFIMYEQAIAIAGWNRTISDYYNAMIAAGTAPKGTFLARYAPGSFEFEGVEAPEGGFVNGLLYVAPLTQAPAYMFARRRAVRPPTQIELYDRQIQTELRKLKELQFEQVEE